MTRYGIHLLVAPAFLLMPLALCPADVIVAVEHHDNNHATRQFKFDTVPPPSRDDAVNTYSWHPSTRGPQVYKLYASDGAAQTFNPKPEKGRRPGRLTAGGYDPHGRSS